MNDPLVDINRRDCVIFNKITWRIFDHASINWVPAIRQSFIPCIPRGFGIVPIVLEENNRMRLVSIYRRISYDEFLFIHLAMSTSGRAWPATLYSDFERSEDGMKSRWMMLFNADEREALGFASYTSNTITHPVEPISWFQAPRCFIHHDCFEHDELAFECFKKRWNEFEPKPKHRSYVPHNVRSLVDILYDGEGNFTFDKRPHYSFSPLIGQVPTMADTIDS